MPEVQKSFCFPASVKDDLRYFPIEISIKDAEWSKYVELTKFYF